MSIAEGIASLYEKSGVQDHELAHFAEPNHTPAFWKRVERALPDFAERTSWLGEAAGKLLWV